MHSSSLTGRYAPQEPSPEQPVQEQETPQQPSGQPAWKGFKLKKVEKPEDEGEDVLKSMTLSRPDRVPKTELEFGEAKKKPTIEDTIPAETIISEGEEEKPKETVLSEDEKVEDKDTVKKVKKRRPKKRPETAEEVPVTAPDTAETPEVSERPEARQPDVSNPTSQQS